MNNLYETLERINTYPKRINILRGIVAVCMAVIAIALMLFWKRINPLVIVLLCVCSVIAIISIILISIFEKNIQKELNNLKNEYGKLKIRNSNNVSNISITIPGSTFLRGPESDGEVLIIAILVDDTIECQYMSKYAVEETFK